MKTILYIIFFGLLISFTVNEYTYAQSSDYEKAKTLIKEIEKPTEEISAEEKIIGQVKSIVIGGEPSTKKSVILRQLTFKEGDIITMKDIALSYKRLYQLDLFWYVKIYCKPFEKKSDESEKNEQTDQQSEESIQGKEIKTEEGVGEIVVHVDVWQAPSYYLFPFQTGAILGDKDIFLSGKTAEIAYFQSGEEFRYWHVNFVDPQFLGSHNVATFMLSHLKDYYGVRDEDDFDLGERYNLERNALLFNLNTRFKEDYRVNVGFEWQNNETRHRAGWVFEAEPTKFFLSEESFKPSDLLILNADISRGKSRGYPWLKEGYYWNVGTKQAIEGLGSNVTFGIYDFSGTLCIPAPSLIDCAVLHAEYKVTSGNPPNYQKPRIGYLMRGHTGIDYFGDSTIYLSGELRKVILDERFQGIIFVDLGKGFDSRKLSFENLDVSSGLGIRADLSKILRLNVIFRADYAWGPKGDRWTFGIGQWY